MTEDLYITKRSLELEWQNEQLKSGKHNIRMIEINKQIQDVIKEIIAQEFEMTLVLRNKKTPSPKFR